MTGRPSGASDRGGARRQGQLLAARNRWCLLPATRIVVACALVAGSSLPTWATTAARQAAPGLRLEAIEVSPDSPGREALCKLRVRLRNDGKKTVFALGFDVKVGGITLPVYRDQLFYVLVPAGQTTTVPLFNFWTSETGRIAPADGRLTVEVTLREAQWVDVSSSTEKVARSAPAGEGDSGAREEVVERWTPAGAVPGLPVVLATILTLSP